jgi:ribosomal protein S27AE
MPRAIPMVQVMESHLIDTRVETRMVECLRCGQSRDVASHREGECARCGYVGWAATGELTELVRRAIRDRPPEFRSLRVVW